MPVFYFCYNRLFSKISIKKPNSSETKIYGFYKSTGVNSDCEGTWFPFRGISVEYGDWWVVKPYIRSFRGLDEKQKEECDGNFSNFFREILTKNASSIYGKKDPHELLERFGSTECMLISFLIGGGYWETQASQPIRTFINKYYQAQLDLLHQSTDEWSAFSDPSSVKITDIDPSLLGVKNDSARIINAFLKDDHPDSNQSLINCPFNESVFEYNVPGLSTQEEAKILKLHQMCMSYQTHLETTQKFYHNDQIYQQKKTTLLDLMNLLDNPNDLDKMEEFTCFFQKNKSLFMQSRDEDGMVFVKNVLTFLSFGLIGYFGLWKVQGNTFQESISDVLADSELLKISSSS